MPEEKPVITVDKKVSNNGAYNEENVKARTLDTATIQSNGAIKKKIIVSKQYANGVKKNTLGALLKNGKVLGNYALNKKELDKVK